MDTLDDKLGEELFRCSNGKQPIFLIGGKPIIYDILNTIERVRDAEMGRPLDDISTSNSAYIETITQVRNRGGHASDKALLKRPFKYVSFFTERTGDIYSGSIILFSEKSENYGFIDRVREQFEKLGYSLDFDVSAGQGILSEDGVMKYALKVDQEENNLFLSFGNHGPRSVDFPESKEEDNSRELKQFSDELTRLEKIANEIAYKGYEVNEATPYSCTTEINPF